MKKCLHNFKKSKKKNRSKYTNDSFVPIKSITNGMIILDNNERVTGIKIIPRNIFILDYGTQNAIIDNLKNVYNMIDYEFWIVAADRPVDINVYLSQLELLFNSTHDQVKRKLIMEDINKANMFKNNNVVDTEYFLLFKEKNNDAIAIRVIALKIPTLNELNHPEVLKSIINKKRGLILVTGPTGSGKSTTLAAMINEINNTREEHIITLEDPIEYLHNHNKCIINQREIGRDSKSYNKALKAVLREDPDVILVVEMRDLETISIAITAAETGHLVFSTLHTIGAVKTIDRIIDVFPPHQQEQVKIQLSSVIQAIISQQLLPNIKCNGRVAALEIMVNTPGIQNLIREGKTNQIESVVQTGNKYGMKTMDMAISELYKKGAISMEIAMAYAVDREILKRFMIL